MEQYSEEIIQENNLLKENKASVEIVDESENGAFDCNICLDSVQDPVVTFCGHLYCYPCIYKWIHNKNPLLDIPNKSNPQCPVCKRDISKKTLVPLYGRGQTTNPRADKMRLDIGMLNPRRPQSPSCRTGALQTQQANYHEYQQQTQGFIVVRDAINPTSPMMGMLGEMLYGWLLGNRQASLCAYPSSYNLVAISSQRARRRAMQADRSLGRICFFLFCCMMMCLILF